MFGCNTYSYMRSHSAEACLARLADFGFQEFELMVHPGHLWPAELTAEQRSAIRRRMQRRGLQLTALNMPNIDINVAGAAAEMRSYSLNLVSDTVLLAGELGARGARPALPGRRSIRHRAVGREHAVRVPASDRPVDGCAQAIR